MQYFGRIKAYECFKALIIGPNPIEAIFYARIAYDIAPGKIENIIVTDKSYAKLYDTDYKKGIWRFDDKNLFC